MLLILNDGALIFLDRFLIGLDRLLVGNDGGLIRENLLLKVTVLSRTVIGFRRKCQITNAIFAILRSSKSCSVLAQTR